LGITTFCFPVGCFGCYTGGLSSLSGNGHYVCPDNINDNDVATYFDADTINKYIDVDFKKWVKINQWRYHGRAGVNENGEFKLQYYGTDLAWHDWVTGIPTRLYSWSTMATETEVICREVKLVCTIVDTGPGQSSQGEFEVYHS